MKRSYLSSCAQVGTDKSAQDFLSRLDNDSKVGKLVDCTSSFEQEQEEYLKKSGEGSPLLPAPSFPESYPALPVSDLCCPASSP